MSEHFIIPRYISCAGKQEPLVTPHEFTGCIGPSPGRKLLLCPTPPDQVNPYQLNDFDEKLPTGENIDREVGVLKEEVGFEGGNPACDVCFVLNIGYKNERSSSGTFSCSLVATNDGEPPLCKRCKDLGRSCDWTAASAIGDPTKLFKALRPPLLDIHVTMDVQDTVLPNIGAAMGEEEQNLDQAAAERHNQGIAHAQTRCFTCKVGREGRTIKNYESMAQRLARLIAAADTEGIVKLTDETSH